MADLRRPSNHRRKRETLPFISCFSVYLIPVVCMCFTVLSLCSVESSKVCSQCDQGRCVNDSCTCLPGWRGQFCDECYGRISLKSGKEGVIHDGAANYSKDLTCSWLLDAEQFGMRIQFVINEFATECVWDHLYIHDGDSAYAPLIAAYSGIMWSSKGKPQLKFKLSGRYVFIHFYSDAAFTLPGFNISYIIDDCALECSEHGVCNNSKCVCEPGWTGPNCDIKEQGCLYNCSDHGNCVAGICDCHVNYKGTYCNVSTGDLYVENIAPKNTAPTLSKLTGRASMSLTPDSDGNLWLLGGYKMGDTALDNNLLLYDPADQLWFVQSETKPNPWPRYGHTTVFYKDSLYLYGGVSGTQVVKDFWRYNTATHAWTELPSGPLNVSGHTAHVVGDTMVVIFGYSPDYGYSNKVLEFRFNIQNWTTVQTKGSQVQGGYGHTSVYDSRRDKIYVYGGYHSQTANSYNLTDKLYQYDPFTGEWFILHNSGSARYLHSSAMINGLMLTFGGNTHNDTRLGIQAKCFSSDFMVYDPDCNSWYTVRSAHVDSVVDNLDRFGQAMVSVNNEIYMFGGFNSVLKKDLLKITAGDCAFYQDKSSCEMAVPGVKCHWKNNTCQAASAADMFCRVPPDPNAACSGYNTCDSCENDATILDCHWCSGTCSSSNKNCSLDSGNCTEDVTAFCSLFHNCKSCQENDPCTWQSNNCVAMKHASKDKTNKVLSKATCAEKACSDQRSCDNCTNANCMWCSNLDQCIDTNSYVVSFHYGQCMDWTTKQASCQANNCSQLKTCAECQARPKCGWCGDETETGTGTCFDGGMTGAIDLVDGKPVMNKTKCPANRWFFNDCPKCQCNGHATCINGTSICNKCEPPTTGPQCQYCSDGYHGNPENGGKCTACFCNGQADTCDPVTGECYCRTRGVTGRNCDRCDDSNKYSGDPKNGGTCYYQLNTDFQYTFNLSKREDSNYTQINFLNIPTSSDRDVDFTLNCSTFALLNITYKSKSFPEEKEYVSGRGCDYFRTKFEHKNHAFGGKENTTFMVYVYDFKTPFMLMISFVQPDKINLLKFFIIFFSCFLSLLLIAAALWKIKHKYDSYRRRQQLIVEMQQMASRPFSTICVEIDRKSDPAIVDKRDHLDSVLRRRKKTANKPSAVSIEPLSDHKAAILTLIIQLPTGDSDYAPSGQSGLAVGSALVSIGSNRKQSLEHIKGDKPKIRKNLNYNHPDTCA